MKAILKRVDKSALVGSVNCAKTSEKINNIVYSKS